MRTIAQCSGVLVIVRSSWHGKRKLRVWITLNWMRRWGSRCTHTLHIHRSSKLSSFSATARFSTCLFCIGPVYQNNHGMWRRAKGMPFGRLSARPRVVRATRPMCLDDSRRRCAGPQRSASTLSQRVASSLCAALFERLFACSCESQPRPCVNRAVLLCAGRGLFVCSRSAFFSLTGAQTHLSVAHGSTRQPPKCMWWCPSDWLVCEQTCIACDECSCRAHSSHTASLCAGSLCVCGGSSVLVCWILTGRLLCDRNRASQRRREEPQRHQARPARS
jgi:hypothetical protein